MLISAEFYKMIHYITTTLKKTEHVCFAGLLDADGNTEMGGILVSNDISGLNLLNENDWSKLCSYVSKVTCERRQHIDELGIVYYTVSYREFSTILTYPLSQDKTTLMVVLNVGKENMLATQKVHSFISKSFREFNIREDWINALDDITLNKLEEYPDLVDKQYFENMKNLESKFCDLVKFSKDHYPNLDPKKFTEIISDMWFVGLVNFDGTVTHGGPIQSNLPPDFKFGWKNYSEYIGNRMKKRSDFDKGLGKVLDTITLRSRCIIMSHPVEGPASLWVLLGLKKNQVSPRPTILKIRNTSFGKDLLIDVHHDPNGGFVGQCREFPGVLSQASTLQELQSKMFSSIEVLLKSIKKQEEHEKIRMIHVRH